MGDKVLVVKAPILPLLLPLLGGLGMGALGRKLGKEGVEAAAGAGAKAAAKGATQAATGAATQGATQAAKEGAKQMSGKQFAMQMAQQQQNAAAQQRQDQKAQQEQRALEMAEKAKGGAGTMQKQLQGVLDDLRLLKGTLQLPTALSEELRDTIKTLDKDHVIVDNKDETLVHNTTPFTEDIIRRLSETEDEKVEEPLFQPQQLFY
tara:strand:+ start:2340 stop:2957 length:618 start_codon:yes stop_codon:yes gene_type:complete